MELRDQAGSPGAEHFGTDLPRLLTYDLSNGEAAEVIEHLRACETCREDLVEAVADGYRSDAILPRWFTAPPASASASGQSRMALRLIRRRSGRASIRRRKWLLVLVVVTVAIVAEVVHEYFFGVPG